MLRILTELNLIIRYVHSYIFLSSYLSGKLLTRALHGELCTRNLTYHSFCHLHLHIYSDKYVKHKDGTVVC